MERSDLLVVYLDSLFLLLGLEKIDHFHDYQTLLIYDLLNGILPDSVGRSTEAQCDNCVGVSLLLSFTPVL